MKEIGKIGDHFLFWEAMSSAVLNDQRKADVGYERLAKEEVSRYLDLYKIELKGKKPENLNKMMCRRDNNTPCEWLRKGRHPAEGEEGYTCFDQTRTRYTMGYCPKFGHKRQPPGTYNSQALDPEQGSERRKVGDNRKMLKAFSSLFEPDVDGDKGLIHTLKGKGGGYALAGTVTYKNTPA